MKRGARAAGFYGPAVVTLELPTTIDVLRATLVLVEGEVVGIKCGDMRLMHPHPVYALCRQLRDSGWPDSALQVRYPDRTPATMVASFHAVAAWPARDLAQYWPPAAVTAP